MPQRTVLAIDIGAESGRALSLDFDGSRLALGEISRFPNQPVMVRGTLYWDILRLYADLTAAIDKHRAMNVIDSIGLDTWAVDFGLIDSGGRLLGNPVHYRDSRTDGVPERVFSHIPRPEVFAHTGIQIMQLNTLYQLYSMVERADPALNVAARLLTIPDLLYYWLTGVQANEYTNATTTQCYDVAAGNWAFSLLDKLHIPTHLFGPVTPPGQILGRHEGAAVVLCAQHDTASAVVGVPATQPDFAYLSSGTWSLLGLEVEKPVINVAAYTANVTNEGGYGGTIRLLKNIMGLWLIQQSKRAWDSGGKEYSYAEIADLAAAAPPFTAVIDPDDPTFLPPGDMPARIRAYCERTGQPAPDSIGSMARCIFESLALKYRYVLETLTGLTGRAVKVLHIVGGGSQNALLNQFTADACGVPVLAGPAEATALGNAITQLVALGELTSVAEGRRLIAESFPPTAYDPHPSPAWEAAYHKLRGLMGG